MHGISLSYSPLFLASEAVFKGSYFWQIKPIKNTYENMLFCDVDYLSFLNWWWEKWLGPTPPCVNCPHPKRQLLQGVGNPLAYHVDCGTLCPQILLWWKKSLKKRYSGGAALLTGEIPWSRGESISLSRGERADSSKAPGRGAAVNPTCLA